ncbi:MAG: serine hydrolase domain-containing protein [Bacteroidota bacterium]
MQQVLLALLLLYSSTLFSQKNLSLSSEAITNILYQHASDDSPGIALGIVKDGKVVYEQYLGYANLEYEIAIDPATHFNIASNAKQFTALCVLTLAEKGKLSLEDDFRTYLPGFYPSIEDRISLANLIAHTSGIRDISYLWGLQGKSWWKLFVDNDDAIELLRAQRDLNFRPGTDYLYSNSNYILLAEIVRVVTGQEFSDYAKVLFEELDMPSTHFRTNYGAIIPSKARPYGNWGGWQEEPSITETHGDGGLFTTLADQLKWEQIIQLNDGSYLSPKLIEQSQSPIEKGYGYGVMFDTYLGLAYRYHDGSTGAYQATYLRFPTRNLSIVLLTNNRSVPTNYAAWQIASSLLELEETEEEQKVYAAKPDQVEAVKNLSALLGNYSNEEGTVIRITEKEGTLYREMYQRDPVALIPEKGGLFEYGEERFQGLKINFTNIGKSNQEFTLYRSSLPPATYQKVSDLSFNGFEKRELNGRFYNDETDTEIILKYREGDTYSLIKNGKERPAKLILGDYLRMMDYYEIRIIRDEDRQVIGLKVDNDRIRSVKFEKR